MHTARILTTAILLTASMGFSLVFTGCNSSGNQASNNQASSSQSTASVTTGSVQVLKDTNFNGVMLNMTSDEFKALGFELGDSVNITIDGTLFFEDVPYYDGYYAATGDYLLVSYPGELHPNFRRAQSTLWDDLPITEDSTICVTLRERGKYLDTQEALSMVYSNNAADFPFEAMFANFRSLSGGNLKEGLVYRSASPIDNSYLRAETVNKLIQEIGVNYALDLSDNEDEFASAAAESGTTCQYYIDLKNAGNVALLDLTNNYSGAAFKQTVAKALYEMCQHEGPYLIHCVEGKDRTGFICMLIESFAGASKEQVLDDYMTTYDNYYGISKTSSLEKYDAIIEVKANDLLQTIAGTNDESQVTAETLQAGAVRYLQEGGLTDEQIAQIKTALCK